MNFNAIVQHYDKYPKTKTFLLLVGKLICFYFFKLHTILLKIY